MNKDLKFEEFNAKNSSTAYMLVYIRKTKAKEILRKITENEIPQSLRDYAASKKQRRREKVELPDLIVPLPF